MKQSITYCFTLFVIKLKKLKSIFSEDPIDIEKARKDDVHLPNDRFFNHKNILTFKVIDTVITKINIHYTSGKLLIFIHGGAFISGPANHHWDSELS